MNIPVMQRNIMTSRSLEGKVSLVTGSTSGIGLGIARALAAAGSSIVLNGFGNPEEIAAMRSRLGSEFKIGVDYSPADMSKPEAIQDMVDGILKSSGRLDVVVNNAGIQHVAPIQEFPVDKWQLILAINLSSAFHTTRCALPSMRQHGWGRIINIASAHGLVAATPRPRSPGSHCPSTEVGRRTEVSVIISARITLRCPALDRVPRQRKSIPVPLVESSNKRAALLEAAVEPAAAFRRPFDHEGGRIAPFAATENPCMSRASTRMIGASTPIEA
jgi:NAD(P)-dependent dehydrogenase (short-subunit alcohol dehydrogenase family)